MSLVNVNKMNLRLILAICLTIAITVVFWTQSRYPALGEKAIMSGAIQLEDPMSFEALIAVEPHYSIWKKVAFTTVNWINTNLQGMVFGIFFGAACLTLLQYIKHKNFRSSFMNSALGLAIGAPMGVCVNCAAPVAKGLYSGGARIETTLSAMIASPTLNIIVLTMMFSLLPFYMAVAKIGLSLLVILVVVPLICRFVPQGQHQLPDQALAASCPLPVSPQTANGEGLLQAIAGVANEFIANLWFIIRMTVPLMILAGALGAIVAVCLPLETLNNFSFGFLGLIVTAIVGVFLPVPIAFDVVISGALLSGGLPVGYVMALLFTLGIFSIYSYFIIGTSVSWRAASLLGGAIIVLGVAAGIGTDIYHKWQTRRALEILSNINFGLVSQAHASDATIVHEFKERNHSITIKAIPFNIRSPAGEKPFTRKEAWHLGIDKPVEFSFKDMWPPFWEGRSISSGDIDKDGDTDLVLASTEAAIYVYLNDGTGNFAQKIFPLKEIRSLQIFNAVLVDLNNDGWLDLFLTTYQSGNYVLWNFNGSFDAKYITGAENRSDATLTLAAAFGDINRDGFLDAALGNWTAGWYRRVPGEESRNRVVLNDDGRFSGLQFFDLPGMPGETLSVLLSDLNRDGWLDLLVGNDFEQPDIFYIADESGRFKQVLNKDQIIPLTTTTTMSIKSADLTNDGKSEIYIAQIAGRSSGISKRLKMQAIGKYCMGIKRSGDREICQKNMDIKNWYKAGNQFDPTFAHKCLALDEPYQTECKAMLTKDLAIQNDDPAICDFIKADQKTIQSFCKLHFLPVRKPALDEYLKNIPQIKRRNVLLAETENGAYQEQAIKSGLDVGGWSWDVKIADFDNDEWQDVYIVNGTWVPNEVTPSNLYFSNLANGNFEERSGPFGLEDYLITAAATVFDLEDDGDLDLVTVPVNGPVVAFINNSQTGNSIQFKIRDFIGNRYGVGTRLEISYGQNGSFTQSREIQVGGGFMSFDDSTLHYGLGEHEQITRVVVHWSTGETTDIDGLFETGNQYLIERLNSTIRE